MPSSSNKRARRSGSDRGRTSPLQDTASSQGSATSRTSNFALQQMFANYKEHVINMVLAELQAEASGAENALPCPFQRRYPMRYRLVKDPACNGRGFKDIADLRDHIKRAHSSKYGCHYCKERFQGRDNAVEDAAKSHRKKCKWYLNKRESEVSQYKPEVMSPDQDKRYFQLDFRRSKAYSPEDKQNAQYWDICKAIWPEYASQEAFEKLDLRNKAAAIEVSRLEEIMDNAMMETVDATQFLMANSRSASQYADSSSRASYDNSPSRGSYEASPRSSYADSPHRGSLEQSPSRAFQTTSPRQGAYEDEQHEAEPSQYNELNSLYAVPQPVRYAERNARDSAYGSSNTDEVPNCWQYGNVSLGDQMLTDPDYTALMDREIQLTGISTRDMGIVSPGYQCSYSAGLEDDDLMMVGTEHGQGDGFYIS